MSYTPAYTNFFGASFFSAAPYSSSLLSKTSANGGPPTGAGVNTVSGGAWLQGSTTGSTNYIYGTTTTGGGTGSTANVLHRGEIADAVSSQLSMFLNSSYTVMTALDSGANWGSLTNATVTGYGASIASNTINIASNTSSVTSISTAVNNLTTRVSTLETTVGGLTSISVTSGGIRVKP